MKLLIFLLLVPIIGFTQITGKIPSNGAVTIFFETKNSVTEGWIRNDQSIANDIEYSIDSITVIRSFSAYERLPFQIKKNKFVVKARNMTSIGNNDWVIATSEILALNIKAKKRIIPKQRKLQCDEIPTPTPDPPVGTKLP